MIIFKLLRYTLITILHFNVPILFTIHKTGLIEKYWQYLSTLDLKEQRLELSNSGTMSILWKQIVKLENSTRTFSYQKATGTLSMTYDSGGLGL